MTHGGTVLGTSVAHGRASVGDIETVAAPDQSTAVADLLAHDGVAEAFVLQTCNRVEAYVVPADEADLPDDASPASRGEATPHDLARAALESFTADAPEESIVQLDHEESLRHLLRVAAGLESVVVGEDQVLGQVRDAFEDARTAGGVGPVLEQTVTKAIRVGERARTETAINEGTLSLAAAAVRLAADHCALDGETALVVGAGEMGGLAAKAFDGTVDELVVANRTLAHARHVANTVDVDATAVPLDRLAGADGPTDADDVEESGESGGEPPIARARVVVTATGSPEPVVPADAFADAGETVVVDIAQPRDVESGAATHDGVTVHDLDALEDVTAETRASRRAAADRVAEIVEEELDRLLTQFKRRRADAVISTMYESAERVKAAELETATAKLDLDPAEAAVLEDMADAIVSRLLAAPTESLRDAAEHDDWATIRSAIELFDPEFGPEGPPFDDAADAPAPEDLPPGVPAAVRERLSAEADGTDE